VDSADFVRDRLSVCYGGDSEARSFLKLLRNTTKKADEIEKDQRLALDQSRRKDLDPRQAARWRNLADELSRRLKYLPELASQ